MTNDGPERVAVDHPYSWPNKSIVEKNFKQRIRAIRRGATGNALERFKDIVKEVIAGMMGWHRFRSSKLSESRRQKNCKAEHNEAC
ncbi:hypothetical protein [Bradyrhizobium arachidis]|uniref:Uncharacterized protein n=1 Tax=Bradyrhizobium arachidis TaxID=858423 RepID=A0AAE7TF46_9BRAD|nr:hypothetical protein [Bradyrhizobium arachidis]QOZ66383.1 hypothetical protein WN72_08180 [Bradyrhizobium arachidis]SFV18328.1 hypothetical protein SAMN05192541_13445 [Bradyrhizobium arachidis]